MSLNLTRNIARGQTGEAITRIQNFLRGEDLYLLRVDRSFGPGMEAAVEGYQKRHKIAPTGVIDNDLLGRMLSDGLYLLGPAVREAPSIPKPDPTAPKGTPSRPPFKPLVSNAEREKVFGKFSYRHSPVRGNPERIVVTDNWYGNNMVIIQVPELAEATGGKFTRVACHKLVAWQMQTFWRAMRDRGLLHHVVSYEGCYNPRFIRGSRTTLSNHAWGTALDINAWYNKLGHTPAAPGKQGSVMPLVELAHEYGFYWGGHFSRMDGMHFEVAVPLKVGTRLAVDYTNGTYRVVSINLPPRAIDYLG